MNSKVIFAEFTLYVQVKFRTATNSSRSRVRPVAHGILLLYLSQRDAITAEIVALSYFAPPLTFYLQQSISAFHKFQKLNYLRNVIFCQRKVVIIQQHKIPRFALKITRWHSLIELFCFVFEQKLRAFHLTKSRLGYV